MNYLCGPCNEEHEKRHAWFFCEICGVYLCKHCMDEHREFKVTKNHSVLAISSRAQESVSADGSFQVLCNCSQKRPVEIYCEDHAKVFCPTCQVIKHRSCNTCRIKEKVSKDTKQEFCKVFDQSNALQAKIESFMQNGKIDCKKLEESKKSVKNAIISFREKVDELLDKLENESLATLENKSLEQSETVEKHLTAFSEILQALAIDKGILEKANKADTDETRFAANVKISRRIAEYETVVSDIITGLQNPKLEFQEYTSLTEYLNAMEGLCRINASRIPPFQLDYKSILDMDVKAIKLENIITTNCEDPDTAIPWITGCSFLSDGSVILCDYNNRKLKLLDSNWSIKKSLNVSACPSSVAVIDRTDAVITYYDYSNNDLQYVHIYPDLKLGIQIKLPETCYGIQVINDEIYTSFSEQSGHYEIWRLDLSLNIKSKIVLNRASPEKPHYFSIYNASAINARLYLTDWRNSKVTCLQQDGRMVFQYEDQALKRPHGIYVDKEGNSIVCGSDSNNVVVITADGRKHRELLTSADITKPRCIDFRPSDNTLIIGCENCNFYVRTLGK